MFTKITSSPRQQSGLSLIELIIFIIVISVGLVGILSVMNVTVKSSADPMLRKQAIALAEAILEEVLTKDYVATYSEADTTNCSNRLLYDGVDNYKCFGGVPATAVIKGTDTLGAGAIAALAGYTATIKVDPPADVIGVTMKKITVTVTGGAEPIELFGYRSNY